jgi:hypothetical protein
LKTYSYTFLYVDGTKVYKTNIDSTSNEFILELQPSSNQFFTIRDFNQLTGELLVNTNTIPGSSSAIATYSAETKQLNVMLKADTGYALMGQRYSKDYSKIVFIESNTICSSKWSEEKTLANPCQFSTRSFQLYSDAILSRQQICRFFKTSVQ